MIALFLTRSSRPLRVGTRQTYCADQQSYGLDLIRQHARCDQRDAQGTAEDLEV